MTHRFKVYDLDVVVLYGESSTWGWLVRTNDERYQVEQSDGQLHDFVSCRGFCATEEEARRTAFSVAIWTARSRVQPFAGRYLDHLCKIDLGKTVEEWTR